MKLTLVPIGSITGVLGPLLPHFESAAASTDGRYSADDILRDVLTGHFLLWVLHEDGYIRGHVTVSQVNYPQMKLLAIQYMGAEVGTLEKSEALIIETLEQFAKDAGCVGMEWAGRPGWKPWAKKYGYTAKGVYQKRFEV